MNKKIKNYLEYYKKINDNAGSAKYMDIMIAYIDKCFRIYEYDPYINVIDFVLYYKDNTNLSNKTINKLIKVLRMIYKHYGIEHKQLETFKLLKEKRTTFTMIEKEDLKKIFHYLETSKPRKTGHIYKTMIYLLYDTGIRPNELFNIKTKNINLKEQYIYLETTKTDINRYIYLTAPMVKRLTNYMNQYNKNDRLFYNIDKDRAFNLRDLKNYYRLIKKATGMTKLHSYMFRHTYITDLINLNVPLNIIQQQAGHQKITTTMIYYHHDTKRQKDHITAIKRTL